MLDVALEAELEVVLDAALEVVLEVKFDVDADRLDSPDCTGIFAVLCPLDDIICGDSGTEISSGTLSFSFPQPEKAKTAAADAILINNNFLI